MLWWYHTCFQCFCTQLSTCYQTSVHVRNLDSIFGGLTEIKARPSWAVKMWPNVQESQPQRKKNCERLLRQREYGQLRTLQYSLPLPKPVPNARDHGRPPSGLHEPVHHLQDGGQNCMRRSSERRWQHATRRAAAHSHTRLTSTHTLTRAVMWCSF